MSLYTETMKDLAGAVISGALVYVYDANGTSLAALTDSMGAPVGNPVVTDDYGIFSFYTADGPHLLDIWHGGRRKWRERITVGIDGVSALVEWWGLKLNDQSAAASNLAAWNACKAAIKNRTMPSLGTVWMSGPMIIDDAYSTTIFPQRSDGYGDATGCRVLSTDTTKDAMIIGAATAPVGGVANYPRNGVVRNPCAGWGVAHAALNASLDNLVAAIGIQYNIDWEIESPRAHEGPLGFEFYANVGTNVVGRAKAFRSAALGGNAATDRFVGARFKGNPAVFAGGNASLHVEHLVVESGIDAAVSATMRDECAVLVDGSFSDVKLGKVETTKVRHGLRVTGNGSGGAQGSNINFTVSELVVDQHSGRALDIQDVGPGGSVQIDKFRSMSTSRGAAMTNPDKVVDDHNGYFAKNNAGFVHVDGVIHGKGAANAGGTMIGFRAENSPGLSGRLHLVDCPRPAEVDGASIFDLDLSIDNPTVTANPYQAAIVFLNLSRGTIKARITGKANAFAQGLYNAANNCSQVTFLGMESVNPACINGGAANKLQINATQITAPGQYTSAGVANAAGTMTVVGSMT